MKYLKQLYGILFMIVALLALPVGNAGATHQEWSPVENDQPRTVKPIIKADILKHGFSDAQEAERAWKSADDEKKLEDDAYRKAVETATIEFNKAKKARDDAFKRFGDASTDYEEQLKSAQTISATIANFDKQVGRYEQDIAIRQKVLTDWLKTQKQGEAVVAAIYTVGLEDTRQELDERADASSMPLMAKMMGTYIESLTTVNNYAVIRDFVKSIVEGTAKYSGDEPFRMVLKTGREGTVWLRIKRYELYPFQVPEKRSSAKGGSSDSVEVAAIKKQEDLEKFLSSNDFSWGKLKPGDRERMLAIVNEITNNSDNAALSLKEQTKTFKTDIAILERKIQDTNIDKKSQVEQLQKLTQRLDRMKIELDVLLQRKNDAELSIQAAQTALHEKKRIRESTIIIKDAIATMKSGQKAVDAIADTIADKLSDVKNDARTHHASNTETVVNNQLVGETKNEGSTEAHIIGIKVIAAYPESDNYRINMAFRVRTVMNDPVKAEAAKDAARKKAARPQDCARSAKLTEGLAALIESNIAQAEANLKEATEICTGSASLHYNFGTVLLRRQKYDDAEMEFNTALQLKPDYAKAKDALAYMRTLPARTAAATRKAAGPQDCIKANEITKGLADLMGSNPRRAEEVLRQAIDLCDSSASLYYNLGVLLTQQKKFDESRTVLTKAVELKPDYAKALYALAYANIYGPGGDRDLARGYLDRALKKEPQNQQYQNMLLMLAGTVDTPPRGSKKRPDALAIVIGNKDYKSSDIPSVKYALKDSGTIKQYLVDALGFDEKNVIALDNATNIDFVKYFGNENDHRGLLYNRIRKGDAEIFVYYSGHGAPDPDTKKAYLVPVDADPSVIKLTGYSLDTLYDNLAKLNMEKNPQNITVVLDSCFSGMSHGGMIIPGASPLYIETTVPRLEMSNAVVFASSQASQISSWYDDKQHGLFTYFFLKNMKEALENNRQLTAEDMAKALQGRDGVNDTAQRLLNREQNPQLIGNKNIVIVP